MQLDSGAFLLFVAAVLLVRVLTPLSAGPMALLAASILFYGVSSFSCLLLLLVLAWINYGAVCGLTAWGDAASRRMLYWTTVILNLSVLIFFRWATAQPANGEETVLVSGADRWIFPLGLSFFTIQMLACVTDVYRRTFQWTTGGKSFILFSLFFPQVSSGPIPRAHTLVPQLVERRRVTHDDFAMGVSLIAIGLLKKFVVANRLYVYVQAVFTTEAPLSTAPVALGIVFNALLLYADFSAYTDIARGAARLFGIRLGENFDRPFHADSVTDFWRRWHISFSSCLKDYLYMPLLIKLRGLGKAAVVISFLVTFAICGIWHSTAWTFMLFGLLHGLALAIEFLSKRQRQRLLSTVPSMLRSVLARAYALSFIFLTIVLFNASSLSQAFGLYTKVLNPSLPRSLAELFAYQGPVMFVLIFVALFCWGVCGHLHRKVSPQSAPAFAFACGVVILLLGELKEGDFVYTQF